MCWCAIKLNNVPRMSFNSHNYDRYFCIFSANTVTIHVKTNNMY